MAKKSKPIDLKQETADISAKIAASYEKLAGKFRQKAQRAAEKVKDAKGEEKLVYETELETLRLADDERRAILRKAGVAR